MKTSLSRKPEAHAWSVEDLLEMVRRGEVRLPEFQRLFKWKAQDVVKLFDSLVRGFPLGTLLFWKRPHSATAGGRTLETPAARGPAWSGDLFWVLDGQQRLTSLAGTLLATDLPENPRFRVAYDLDREEFVHVRAGEEATPRRLALYQAFDTVRLLAWMDAHRADLNDADRRKAMELNRALREYRIPAYVVLADDEETASLIFDRTNSTGQRLDKAEVFKALHAGRTSQEPSTVEGLAKSVEDLEFGPLDQDVYLQATVAVAGLDVTRIDHALLSRSELREALEPAAAALRRTLVFLKEDARIPNSALLPYRFPIIGLARFFRFFPAPMPRSRDLLSRWVWRGAITGRHRAREYEYVRATLASIGGVDEEAVVQDLLEPLRKPDMQFSVDRFSLHSADTRMLVLALLALRPRDLRTGELLDGAGLVARHGSRALVPVVLDATGGADEDAARKSAFSRVVQPPMSRTALLALLRTSSAPEVTASLGLPEPLIDLVRGKQDPGEFARMRMAWLTSHVLDFLESRARWSESDRPSLQGLVVEDE